MTAQQGENTEWLLDRVAGGDRAARGRLLQRHAPRLRQMVALRLDRRLAARVDPSDVVQESLAEADRKLSDYARARPLPFYPWLRQIAWEHLLRAHRRHLHAGGRSVRREEAMRLPLPDELASLMAERLAGRDSSPSARLERSEQRQRVRAALDLLSDNDRDVLVLRYLEDLTTRETAAVLGLSESAVKMRQLRALQRLHELLGEGREGEP
jgi:RNA polymerase sigma-70 factor (ECF subfamily)